MVDLGLSYKMLCDAMSAAHAYVEVVEPGDHGPAAILGCTVVSQLAHAADMFECALRQTGWVPPEPAVAAFQGELQ